MKKFIVGAAATAAFFASSLPVFAVPSDNFGGQGDAWTNDYGEHYVNNNNPENRKDWTNQRFAVPGEGGANANENSAVIEWGTGTLVDPRGTL